ncbi:YbaB/EbfC family nucleoid-associated protein [Micromonospora olivasterospora]|uniref:YbaB/EbfC DNA-binding family protein n=1 Tax=Micromonospora olivasterospora TaxID=1880 RepID=A0A562I3J4_MICOL|nr:YbaB/EbfC family nucleoid-associated protein [Micromonospora olivasterospora]TWH65193.1 YbaB/EbfC DNA-binding family protein [Micromonospora olivasterospora]
MSGLGDEELLAEMRAALDEVEAMADRVRRRVPRSKATVEEKKKLLSVTVGGQGELTRITFNRDAYRRLAPAELADLIVTTAPQRGRTVSWVKRDHLQRRCPGSAGGVAGGFQG